MGSTLLDTLNKSGTSNELMRDALGLDSTAALWVEDRLGALVEEFEEIPLSNEAVGHLRRQMAEFGLERFFPDTLAEIAGEHEGSPDDSTHSG